MNNISISDSLVEKIRKLLALSSNLNDSKEQAELAMKKAVELATQSGINLATIQVFENKKSEDPIIKGEEISLGKRKSVCQKYIAWLLQNHFHVKVIYEGGRYTGNSLILIGLKKDIEVATYIQGYLNQEFMRLWHQYRKANPAVQTSQRNSYLWGLYEGLTTKLKNQESETESETFSTMESNQGVETTTKIKECYAVTKVSHKKRLEKSLEDFYPRLHTISRSYTNYNHSESARESGFNAGKNISLRKGINAGCGGRLT